MAKAETKSSNSVTCPRLIEVALPIREISAESVRDKSLRHGHISTLHLWWARRPLAACRAVVFASLVPDPDDPRCPLVFRAAVECFLKARVSAELKQYFRGRKAVKDEDPYRPYEGVPDTLRNRLLMFIARWSPEAMAFEKKGGKEPDPKELLDDRSLAKWETSDPANPQRQEILRIARELVKAANGGAAPVVLDPFAGGGAIPLEAGRLGCQAIANDYNPVAYLILRATCEFPQKYGKPGRRKVIVEEFGKQHEKEIEVPNVLVHDFEKWANWILGRAREKIGHLYPPGKDGRPVVGYLWARTAPCSNPSCRGEIPLLRSLLVCNKKGKQVALTMAVDKKRKNIRFGVAEGKDIKATDGTMQNRGNTLCPYCGQVSPVADLRTAGLSGRMGDQMVGVFGKYERVEKADGTRVEIPELLDTARKAARDAIAGEFRGDNLSTLYYVWANLYGASEQSWDDARLVVQIGGESESAMEVARGQGIFVVDGSKCRLALLGDRAGRRGLGADRGSPLIDSLHRAMLLWKEEKRPELVSYLTEHGILQDEPFWKLAQALFEVLLRGMEDWKLVSALLGERQTLRAEGKRQAARDEEMPLFSQGDRP